MCSVGSLADRLRDRMRPRGQDDGAKGRDGRRGIHGLRGIARTARRGKALEKHGMAQRGMALAWEWERAWAWARATGMGKLNNLAGPDDPAWRSRNKGGDRRGQRGRARGKTEPEACLRVCARKSSDPQLTWKG